MTPEELMKPRYKAIADYPKSTFTVGEIYPAAEIKSQSFYNQYPHLFKKLEWWEERKKEEMPQYVKWVYDNINLNNKVEKVEGLEIRGRIPLFKVPSQTNYIDPEYFLPASEEDYLNQAK